MHSGILRSAFQTPVQRIGCGGCQRSAPVGGWAKGTPYQAFTPAGSTMPATAPLTVWMGGTAFCTGKACTQVSDPIHSATPATRDCTDFMIDPTRFL